MEKSYAEHHALLEREHWWFRARWMILRDLLAQLEWPQQPRTLELVMPIDDIRIRRRACAVLLSEASKLPVVHPLLTF